MSVSFDGLVVHWLSLDIRQGNEPRFAPSGTLAVKLRAKLEYCQRTLKSWQ